MFRLLALTVRPETGPDTRYRITQYIPHFRRHGIEVTHRSLYSDAYYRRLGASNGRALKAWGLGSSFFRRFAHIAAEARGFDAVWISRELFPLGPPILERLLFKQNPNVILDIDDAIYQPDVSKGGFVHRKLRDFNKLERIAPRFRAIVCGNEYLANYFRGKNEAVHVIPTVVPMSTYGQVRRTVSNVPRIGWIGTPTNALHLNILRPALEHLSARCDFTFQVVGLPSPLDWLVRNLVSTPWSLSREIDYFSHFDIGVMPLEDTPFTRGKCAFKLIQYMAAGLPVVASPVGSNLDVVAPEESGFFAHDTQGWIDALSRLLADKALRSVMGEKGRKIVTERFSLEKHIEPYANLIKARHDK